MTVAFNQAAAFPDIRIAEYSGADTSSPLDVTAGAIGTGGTPSSGAATTTSASELIFGAGMTTSHFAAAGSGFTSRIITSPDGDIAEDRSVSTSGSYTATATLSYSGGWIMQMATFRGGSGGGTGNPARPWRRSHPIAEPQMAEHQSPSVARDSSPELPSNWVEPRLPARRS